MTASDRAQTAKLSGLAASTDRTPIGGLCVMAVSVLDILRQHTARTDDAGRFAIDLPCGEYDLLFFDEIHEPLVLAGVTIDGDLAKDVVRPRAGSAAAKIHGVVGLPDGAPASGCTIELHDGTASNMLTSVVAGGDGGFEIADCPYGYHLLLIRDRSGEAHWVPAPKPETSIEISVTLADARPVERLVLAGTSPTAKEAVVAFTVCRVKDEAVWRLSGGIMAPDAVPLRTNVEPLSVNVYVVDWGAGYLAYVDRREPVGPFGPVRPPAGYYQFTDETGETYLLIAILPYVHSVLYRSSKPNINAITFTQGIPYSGAWPDAPWCG